MKRLGLKIRNYLNFFLRECFGRISVLRKSDIFPVEKMINTNKYIEVMQCKG